ncbi:hypothetical protein EPN87_04570 [archaeon]|nr:MAG: hypothetical protein EPN87_04570 [archaeon]
MKSQYIIAAVVILIIVIGISNIKVPTKTAPLSAGEVLVNAPAVDDKGNGVSTILRVSAKPGTGKVLVDVNQIIFWADTQQSIQTARSVAQQATNNDLSKVDLTYSIDTNASLIEGPSAGAALTIATIAALENKTLNNSVMITGTINPDGTIGEVGGISAKASAAKSTGATLFLVPQGQGVKVNYEPEQECEQIASYTICTTTYKPTSNQTGEINGIRVVEVSDIQDALKYFFR